MEGKMKKIKRIGLIIVLFTLVGLLSTIVAPNVQQEESNQESINTLRMDYTVPEERRIDTDGNLLVPFDLAYPESFSNGDVNYDKHSVLLKMPLEFDGELTDPLATCGLESIEIVFKDNQAVWYQGNVALSKDIHVVVKELRKLSEIYVVDYHYTYVSEMIPTLNETIEEVNDLSEIFIRNGANKNPKFSDQWYIKEFGIKEAWDWMDKHETYLGGPGGSPDVVVAVIDTGVDYNHPDLTNNMWVNPNEIVNGSDSDSNGYVDDVHGVNVINNTGNPMDDHGHGTHVAGIIAASNNQEGIVGIAYNTKIMAVKAGMSSGFFTSSAIAKAITYASSQGADVINMSFGGSLPSIAVQDALMNAYTASILVASAGNQGLPNQRAKNYPAAPNYPAALSYVIGVMSVGSNGVESAFTNWDYKTYNNIEYEVYAPGEGMISTLPNGQYATWSGTSMAAPVVSGIAALVRSVYNDRDIYPNKFVMGQIAAASTTRAICLDPELRADRDFPLASMVDAYAALTKLPKPDVNLFDYYLFDPISLSDKNNGDGIVDAGETIQVGIVLRNRWGKSMNTNIMMDTLTPMGEPLQEGQESYLTFTTPTVNFGDVGTYSTKDFLTREGSIVKGVEQPFVFVVDEDTPNDYIVKVNVSGTYQNALDPLDTNVYSLSSAFFVTVRKGIILPNRIQQDMVLDSNNLYIIPNSMIIESTATVTVMPGTKIQFWSDDPNDAYAESAITYLRVEGRLHVEGTAENMVEIFPSELRDRYEVKIYENNQGYVSIKYANIKNPNLSISYLANSHLSNNYTSYIYYRGLSEGKVYNDYRYNWDTLLTIKEAENNIFKLLYGQTYGYFYSNLFQENALIYSGHFENNVFLTNNRLRYNDYTSTNSSSQIYRNISPQIEKIIFNNETGKTYIYLQASYVSNQIESRESVQAFANSLGGDFVSIETEAELSYLNSNNSETWRSFLVGLGYNQENEQLSWASGESYDLSFNLGKAPSYVLQSSIIKEYSDYFPYAFIIEVPGEIYTNNIYLNDTQIEIDLNSVYQIPVSLNPTTVDIANLKYHSDDENVVTVSESGLVTPVALGEAFVYVYSEDYQIENKVLIKVVERVDLVSLDAYLDNYQLSINSEATIKIDFNPFNTTQKFVTYSSGDESIVKVNQYGEVEAVGVGTTTITVTSQDGAITDGMEVTVVSPVTSIAFKESTYVTNLTNTNDDFMPTIFPLDATNKNLIWESSNPEVAYVDENNQLIKLKNGVTTLVAKVENTELTSELILSINDSFQFGEVLDVKYYYYYFALYSDGNIYQWGKDILAPKKLDLQLTKPIIDFGFANDHLICLQNDGTIKSFYFWNYCYYGTPFYYNDTYSLSSLTSIVQVETDPSYHSVYALRSDGSVWVAGSNVNGQLGDGTFTNRMEPVQALISDVVSISCGSGFVDYLDSQGNLYTSGGYSKISTPTIVKTNVKSIESALNNGIVIARTTSETIIYDYSTNINGYSISQSQGLDYSSYGFYFSILENGTVFASGYTNNYGQFGLGYFSENRTVTGTMQKITNAKKMFLFYENIFIQTSDGRFYGTGLNTSFQLANFSTTNSAIPVQIFFGLQGNEGGFLLENNPFVDNTLYMDNILLDFNEALVISDNYSYITLKDSNNMSIAITKEFLLDKIIIKPFVQLQIGGIYTLRIPADAISTKFMIPNEELIYSFTYLGEQTSISLMNQSLHNGDWFDQNTISMEFEYTFAQPGDNYSQIAIYDTINNQKPVNVSLVDNLLIIDGTLDYGQYHIIIPSGALKDNLGGVNPLLEISFEVKETMKLISSTHNPNDIRKLVGDDVVFTFNIANQGTNFNNIALIDANGLVIESLVSIENNVLTINPISDLQNNSKYRVLVPEGALVDGIGNVNSLIDFTFTTYNPIELLSTSINEAAQNINLNQTFRIFYNYAQVGSNFNEIKLLDSSSLVVAANVSLMNNTIYIKSNAALNPNSSYSIVVPTGAVVDELGVSNLALTLNFGTIIKTSRFYWNETNVMETWEQYQDEGKDASKFINNAFLNDFNNTNVEQWLRFQATEGNGVTESAGMGGNYWGTVDEFIIQKQMIDFDDFQNLIDIKEGQYLTIAPENTFPFVTNVKVLDSEGNEQYSYGNETVQFVVTFNRDMDVTIPLDFRFGSSLPYAEYQVVGSFVDPRTWIGFYELRSFVESGNQFVNIQNGRAADDNWLTLGWDVHRFMFIYDTTEAQAMTMQGHADVDGIHLNWVQDDYPTFAGYNVYRSQTENGTYERINDYILPFDSNYLVDHSVEPGKLYYYKFTVVLTDFDIETGGFKESDSSGKISIRALDTLLPNIYHTPIYQAYENRNLVLSAVIVDNVVVSEAAIYFRNVGETTYRKTTMNKMNDRYVGVISANYVTLSGVEYYLEAYDGLNYQYYGSSQSPVVVQVTPLINENAMGDVNGDGLVTVLDALLILRHINGFIVLNADELIRADLNKNGSLASAEALVILQYAIGARGTLIYE